MKTNGLTCVLLGILTSVNLSATIAGDEGDSDGGEAQVAEEKQSLGVSPELYERLMSGPCPAIDVKDGELLNVVLKRVIADAQKMVDFPISYVVDHTELALEGVEIDEVKVKEIGIVQGSHSLEAAVTLIFSTSADTDVCLDLLPHNGHLLLTTFGKARVSESYFLTKVYDVSELLATPEEFSEDQRLLLAEDRGVSALVELVRSQHHFVTWRDGRTDHSMGGVINSYGQYLVVTHSRQVHQNIASILDTLRTAISDGGSPMVLKSESSSRVGTIGFDQNDSNMLSPKAEPAGVNQNLRPTGTGFFSVP